MESVIVRGKCGCGLRYLDKLKDEQGWVLIAPVFCLKCKQDIHFSINEDDNQDRENAKENKSGEDKDEGAVH